MLFVSQTSTTFSSFNPYLIGERTVYGRATAPRDGGDQFAKIDELVNRNA